MIDPNIIIIILLGLLCFYFIIHPQSSERRKWAIGGLIFMMVLLGVRVNYLQNPY
uniref:Uncharacterized protein n=1 Tax=viral metagenome TaxID=1070528 RepID=A0A6C0B2T5_9ZZZZ